MAWARLDDGFPEHPKVLAVGPFGLAVFVRALCYSARNLTDGFIPDAATASFTVDFARTSRTASAIDWPSRLVAAGLWDRVDGGFIVHDYLSYNPSEDAGFLALCARRLAKWRFTRLFISGPDPGWLRAALAGEAVTLNDSERELVESRRASKEAA